MLGASDRDNRARMLPWWIGLVSLAVLLAGPVAYSLDTVSTAYAGALPLAGPRLVTTASGAGGPGGLAGPSAAAGPV